jgi:type I restriction enzyme S subunit
MARVEQFSAGSLSKTVNLSSLLRLDFALPPLEEQRRIAEVLTAIDNLLDALAEERTHIHNLWRAISAYEFSLRDDVSSELLDAHYDNVSGQADPTADAYRDLPLIAPNHIESGTGRILAIETARDQNALSGKYAFDAGVVLYSKIRPSLIKATIAPCKGLCSADMYALTARQSIRADYLLEIVLSDRFTQFAVSGSMRTGIPKLNRDHLARYRCNVPALTEQDYYLGKVAKIHDAKQDVAGRISSASELMRRIMAEVLA